MQLAMVEKMPVSDRVDKEQRPAGLTYKQAVEMIRREVLPKVENGTATDEERAMLALVTHAD